MLYRSLRNQAFKKPEHSIYCAPKWPPINAQLHCTHSTDAPFQSPGTDAKSSPEQLGIAARKSESDAQKVSANDESPSIADQPNKSMGGSHQCESSSANTQAKFYATYSRTGEKQPLFLPELPKSLNNGQIPDPRRQKVLRYAILQAAVTPSHRRPQFISGVINSESRLRASCGLLYPYCRRPPGWTRNFNIIFLSRVWRQSRTSPQSRAPKLSISQYAGNWFDDLSKDQDIEETSRRWRQLSWQQKQERWPHIMLRCLLVSTEQALHFLLATHVEPFPPFEVVMDSLVYLKRARGDQINSNADLRGQYMQILSQQRQETRWPYSMERVHLDLFVEECSGDEGRQLFEQLVDANVDLSYHCMLLFMDLFTRTGDADMAIKALNHIDPNLRLQSDPHLLARCTNLLKLDSVVSDVASANFRLLPQILEAGVKPDLPLYNMIMKNAVDLGASVVAWDLLRYAQDQGLPTNARTYLILMQDALARRDSAGLQEIFTTIKIQDDLLNNPYLMAYTLNVIRIIHGHDLKMCPSVVFSNMLAVYSRIFSTAPLKHLKMVSETTRPLPDSGQPEPDSVTLAYVVRAYVLAQQSPKVVQSLLDWVEHLMSEGDKIALALAQCVPFYDGVILFFARRSTTFPRCLRIVQSMLDRHIQPSAAIWDTLALGFTKHRHFAAAAVVRNMMNRQGLRPKGWAYRMTVEKRPNSGLQESAGAALQELEDVFEGNLSDDPTILDIGRAPQLQEQDVCDGQEDLPSKT